MKTQILYILGILAVGYLSYLVGFNKSRLAKPFGVVRGIGSLDGIPIKYDITNPDSVLFMFDYDVPKDAIFLSDEQRNRLRVTLGSLPDTSSLAQQIRFLLQNNYYEINAKK